MPETLSRRVGREAREILATCSRGTARSRLAWAAGVYFAGHAIDFYNLPPDPSRLAPEYQGTTLDGDRSVLATRKDITISGGYDPDRRRRLVVAAVTWPEVAALMTPARIGAELHARIREACRARRDRTPEFHPERPLDWHRTAEARAERQQWGEIERLCDELGAEAWDRCRVNDVEQLDLFGELA